MCLAIAGRIVSIAVERPAGDPAAPAPPDDEDLWRVAVVDFGGVRQPVSLACLPQARPGDRVLVHVGLALCLVEDSPEPEDRQPEETATGEAGPVSRARADSDAQLDTIPPGLLP